MKGEIIMIHPDIKQTRTEYRESTRSAEARLANEREKALYKRLWESQNQTDEYFIKYYMARAVAISEAFAIIAFIIAILTN
jgi:hypothetical protein